MSDTFEIAYFMTRLAIPVAWVWALAYPFSEGARVNVHEHLVTSQTTAYVLVVVAYLALLRARRILVWVLDA